MYEQNFQFYVPEKSNS